MQLFKSTAFVCMPQSFTFITDPCLSTPMTLFQAKFPSSLTSPLLLFCHSGQIPSSQDQAVPANLSPS